MCVLKINTHIFYVVKFLIQKPFCTSQVPMQHLISSVLWQMANKGMMGRSVKRLRQNVSGTAHTHMKQLSKRKVTNA